MPAIPIKKKILLKNVHFWRRSEDQSCLDPPDAEYEAMVKTNEFFKKCT